MSSILGVTIDNFSKQEILHKVDTFLLEDCFHQIATVNPEFILQAQKDAEFKSILNACDLHVADGVGIWFAFLRFGSFLKNRMTGIDLMSDILRMANEKKLKVFLVSYAGALSSWEETRDAIAKIYPNLEINGANLNTVIARRETTKQSHTDTQKSGESKKEIATLLSVARNDIVFCNLGMSKQEKFLHSLKTLENAKIKLTMGVGGSFDFLTGKRQRAPKFLQKIGLEWLWRFVQEPKYRAKRIFHAVVIFSIKVIFNL
ncbi:MAG: WecB/TagA/CpsF family glycosyltransferase [Candidatus Moranbacteria bacterium]|nr:WecB/TagA/CpsF family glycosyltransferase [Candidatus Moranbacteria bacterium]